MRSQILQFARTRKQRGISGARALNSSRQHVAGTWFRALATSSSTSARTLPDLPLFKNAANYAASINHPAIISNGKDYSYAQLLRDATDFRDRLLKAAGTDDLRDQRVSFLCPNRYEYAVAQWGVWAAGGVAVPVSTHQPPAEMEYTVGNSESSISVVHRSFASKFAPVIKDMPQLKIVEMEDIAPRNVTASEVGDMVRNWGQYGTVDRLPPHILPTGRRQLCSL